MTYKDCDLCGSKGNPLNDTLKINGKIHCASCIQTHYPEDKFPAHLSVAFKRDPTICSFCGKDYGSDILGKVDVYRACAPCDQNMRNKAFPKWVKAFFAGILLIMVGSFCWNWKYYQAYNDVNEANAFIAKKDLEDAAASLKSAAGLVPEVPDLAILAHYFKGLNLLQAEEPEKALAELDQCSAIGENFRLDYFRLEAKSSIAFRKKDFDNAIKLTLEELNLDPEDPPAIAAVAAAYACRYAVKGSADDLKNANAYLAKAKAIDNKTPEFTEYYNLIDYRIQNRSTITNKEFRKEYPNGWTKN